MSIPVVSCLKRALIRPSETTMDMTLDLWLPSQVVPSYSRYWMNTWILLKSRAVRSKMLVPTAMPRLNPKPKTWVQQPGGG